MNMEKLESLGISKEHAEGVLRLYASVSSDQLATSDELSRVKAELSERDSQIEALKTFKGDSDALKGQVAELQKQNKEASLKHREELDRERKVYAIKQNLLNGETKPHDISIVLSQMNLDDVSIGENGDIRGLKEQHDRLLSSMPFLFVAATEAQHKGVNIRGKREDAKATEEKPKVDDGDFGKQMAMRNLKRL